VSNEYAMDDSLRAIFFPRSIAVIGASATEGKLGHAIMINLQKAGFSGKIYPVNPKAHDILGFTAYPQLTEVPGPVDLAIVVIQSQHVESVVNAAAQKGIRGLIVISAGFSETRDSAQITAEEHICAVAQEAGMAVIGPNCQGVLSARGNLAAWFGPLPKRAGNGLFITQSGGLAGTLIGWTNRRGIGIFDSVVSIGNKCLIDEAVLLESFIDDPDIHFAMCYIEGFKPMRGKAFLDAAKKFSQTKPIVVLKGGRFSAGARATVTHTGSLAGSDRVFAGAMKQAGVILTNSIREFIDVSRQVAAQPVFADADLQVAVLTNLGGPGVITADLCERYGIKVPPTPSVTKELLREELPPYCAVGNPIDLAGDPAPERYQTALDILYQEEMFNGIIIVAAPLVGAQEIAANIVRTYRSNPKPTAVCWMDEESWDTVHPVFEDAGLPLFEMPENAVRAMVALRGKKLTLSTLD